MDIIDSSQVIDNSGLHEDENTKKRREILARRPSYRKILNELGGCEISGKLFPSSSSSFFSFAAAFFSIPSILNASFVSLFFSLIVEDKGDSPGIDSDSSSSSPAPPSSHNQRTASSVAISGTHYQAGLIKGIIRPPESWLSCLFFLSSRFLLLFYLFHFFTFSFFSTHLVQFHNFHASSL